MEYLTVAAGADTVAQIEVKRSRFLAVLRRVDSETAARELVAQRRKELHDARHHCSAFVVGPTGQLARSSDDGEPSGTAGMPMLEVLRGNGLSDVAVVVSRYFGGILLGAGGLVRAYSDAVAATVAAATVVRRVESELFTLALPHADAGRVESELRAAGIAVVGVEYAAEAVLTVAAEDGELEALQRHVAGATSGAGALHPAGTRWVDRRQ